MRNSDHALDRRLWLSLLLNAAITAAEFVGGMFASSIALLADAVHNLNDVVALVLAIVARKLGRRPPSTRHTYGLKRVEVLAALINALFLLGVTALIAREALERILHPRPVRADIMLAVASIALVANVLAVFLLRSHPAHDLNMKTAFLHLLQDALASLVVVIAALFVHTPVGLYLDPIASLVVGIVVLHSAVGIVWEALGMLVEAVPPDVNVKNLVQGVAQAFPKATLHHVHVWQVGPGQRVLTAHLSVPDMDLETCEALSGRIRAFLAEHWNIQHATLEPEVNGCGNPDMLGSWEMEAGTAQNDNPPER